MGLENKVGEYRWLAAFQRNGNKSFLRVVKGISAIGVSRFLWIGIIENSKPAGYSVDSCCGSAVLILYLGRIWRH